MLNVALFVKKTKKKVTWSISRLISSHSNKSNTGNNMYMFRIIHFSHANILAKLNKDVTSLRKGLGTPGNFYRQLGDTMLQCMLHDLFWST